GRGVKCGKCGTGFFAPPQKPAPAIAPLPQRWQAPAPPSSRARPVLLAGAVALCLLFVGSGVALTIHYLSDASSRPAEDDKNDGHPVALAPVGKPPKPPGQKHQRPPTVARKKQLGLKQPAHEAALPPDQGNRTEKKPPAPAKEASAEKPKSGASGQQAKRRPTAPEPPVPAARLRGSRPLGNDLVTAAVPKPLGKAVRKGLA